MHIGKARAIFSQIHSDKYTELEKAKAILQVTEMTTHNGVTKQEMLEVVKWLWHQRYEVNVVDEAPQEEKPQQTWKQSLMKHFTKVE